MKVSYYNWHFKGRGQYTNAFIETLYLTVLVDYSRVPNSRRDWNNRGRGVDIVIIINNRGGGVVDRVEKIVYAVS